MSTKERYYFDLRRDADDEHRKGAASLKWLIERMEQGSYDYGIIGSSRLDITEDVADGMNELSPEIVEKLRQADKHAIETEFGDLHLFTKGTDQRLPLQRSKGVAAVVDPDDEVIKKLESDQMVEEICVINWPDSVATTEWIEGATKLEISKG